MFSVCITRHYFPEWPFFLDKCGMNNQNEVKYGTRKRAILEWALISSVASLFECVSRKSLANYCSTVEHSVLVEFKPVSGNYENVLQYIKR